nr:FAD-dependent oxidoreductase [Pelagibius litoralis]
MPASFQPLPFAAPLPDVIIVGGGVIGLAAGQLLSEAGCRAVLIEKGEPAGAASRGNAGAFAFSDIMPLASPGILLKAPGWLLDPLGPLAIPPHQFLTVLPWLIGFFRASWPDRVRAAVEAQAALNGLARTEMDRLVAAAGLASFVRSDGSLQLYESAREWKASLPGWALRADHGIAFEHLDAEGLAALQPGLAGRFVKATFVPAWQTVTDPRDFAQAIGEAARRRGLTLCRGEVAALEPDGDGVTAVLSDGQRIRAGHAVLAAGAWSKTLAAALGDPVPLIPERGYNTTLPPGAFDLRRQLIFGGHGFVVTPLATGIRVGGASELAGFEAPVNFKRSTHMLAKAAAFMPGRAASSGWVRARRCPTACR